MPPDEQPPHLLPVPAPARLPTLSSGWCPFGPAEAGLWVGPNMAVAQADGRGGFRVVPPVRARKLLLSHALTRSAPIDRALDAATANVPLGAPFDTAVRAYARALPAFACVLMAAGTEALLLRAPEAVLHLGAGKLGEFEQAHWRTGADALALLLRHRPSWEGGAGADVLSVRPEPSDSQRLRRALGLGAGVLAGAPVLAAPLLLAGAVPWLIATAAVGTTALGLAPALLRGWDRSRPQPAIRLDPWRLWLPAGLGPTITDRADLRVRMSWRAGFGVANTGVSGRAPSVRTPPMTFLHLRAPDLDLTLGRIGAPAADADTDAEIPRAGDDAVSGAFALLRPEGFAALAARLAPARPAPPRRA